MKRWWHRAWAMVTAGLILAAGGAWAGVVEYAEDFEAGAPGWAAEGSEGQVEWGGGVLQVGFAKQARSVYQSEVARVAVRGGVVWTNVSFAVRGVGVKASAVRVVLHGAKSGRVWQKTVSGGDGSGWVEVNERMDGSWWSGPGIGEKERIEDMGDVDWVGVYVRRHGDDAAQTYELDDFRMVGEERWVGESVSGVVRYRGWQRGAIRVVAEEVGERRVYETVLGRPGEYEVVGLEGLKSYEVWAFRDADNDGRWDSGEPWGEYAGNPVWVGVEGVKGVDILLRDGEGDRDGDGLPDNEESQRGTNPLRWDTDGDGVGDGSEVLYGYNPLDRRSRPRGGVEILKPRLEAIRTTNWVVEVRGRAWDSVGVASVEYETSRGEEGVLAGTSNWAGRVALYEGTNTVRVTARGLSGNESRDAVVVMYDSVMPWVEEAILRAGMVVEGVEVPETLTGGQEVGVSWRVRTYVPVISAMKAVVQGSGWVTNLVVMGEKAGSEEGSWRIGPRRSRVYRFEGLWEVPDIEGQVRLGFVGALADGRRYVPAVVAAGADGWPYGGNGREIVRQVLPGGMTGTLKKGALERNVPFEESLESALLRGGCTALRTGMVPDNWEPGSVVVCEWNILSFVPVRSKVKVVLPGGGVLQAEGSLVASWTSPLGIGGIRGTVYRFAGAEFVVPNDPGVCRVKILTARPDGAAWVPAAIPNGGEARPIGTEGREFARDIVEPEVVPVVLDPYGGEAAGGELAFAGEADWYEFEARDYREYGVAVEAAGISGGTAVTVYGPDGWQTAVAEGELEPATGVTSVAVQLRPGTYYVRVSSPGGATGTYRIGVTTW